MQRGLEITTCIGCSIRCVYCPQDQFMSAYFRGRKAKSLSLDVFRACLDKVPLDVEIDFSSYAEPWLNPECTKMVLYAHEKGYRIRAFTTAVGMGESDVDALGKVPFSHFDLHLPDNKGYMKIRVDDEYLSVIRRLITSNIRNLSYNCRLFGRDDEGLHPKVKEVFDRAGVSPDITRWKINTRAGNIDIESRPRVEKIRGRLGRCPHLVRNMLLPNGDVALCCMDWGLRHVLGNLLETDYESLFKGREYRAIIGGHKAIDSDILCRTCEWGRVEPSLRAKGAAFLRRLLRGSARDDRAAEIT
ncbi:MAG: radical SAM/SPASM domain-containing protein [Candidatus Eisenbacteria bacterium]